MNDTNREAEIRERERAATGGPWKASGCAIFSEHPTEDLAIYDEGGHTEADAAFIAHAREDIPYLLSALDSEREAQLAAEALLKFDGGHLDGMFGETASCSYVEAWNPRNRVCTCGYFKAQARWNRARRALPITEDSNKNQEETT